MKECFFCLEQMLDQEHVCRHCKNWQPTNAEIAWGHERAVKSLTITGVGVDGFYGGVLRGLLLWALLIVLSIVNTTIKNNDNGTAFEKLGGAFKGEFIDNILEGTGGQRIKAVLGIFTFVFFSVAWEFMRVSSRVKKNRYLIERELRYQLQGAPAPADTFYIHILIVGIIILMPFFLFR